MKAMLESLEKSCQPRILSPYLLSFRLIAKRQRSLGGEPMFGWWFPDKIDILTGS